jgi:hypothetical protein
MFMKAWAIRLVLACFWLISGNLVSASVVLAENTPISSKSTAIKPFTVSKIEFGVKKVDSQGKLTISPTDKIPLQVGVAYGWRIQLLEYRGDVKWREVLKLPKPPNSWSTQNSEDFSISPDGTTAVTRKIQLTKDGTIENFWVIAPGDPTGKYEIEVYVNEHKVSTFEFEIVSSNKV